MKTKLNRQVAVWIDSSNAKFIEHDEGDAILIETLESPYNKIQRIKGEKNDTTRFGDSAYSNNENKKNNITRNELNEYFKTIENKLHNYDRVLLTGPGNTKDELKNRLNANKLFSQKNIVLENSDKLTDNQLLAYVKEFYSGKRRGRG